MCGGNGSTIDWFEAMLGRANWCCGWSGGGIYAEVCDTPRGGYLTPPPPPILAPVPGQPLQPLKKVHLIRYKRWSSHIVSIHHYAAPYFLSAHPTMLPLTFFTSIRSYSVHIYYPFSFVFSSSYPYSNFRSPLGVDILKIEGNVH
jgi:hypothetical protein